jgi:hypothetical protein
MDRELLRKRLVSMRSELNRASAQFTERIPSVRVGEPWRAVNDLLDYPRQEEHLWAWAYMAHSREQDRKEPRGVKRQKRNASRYPDWEEDYESPWEIAEHEVLQRRVDRIDAETRTLEQELHLAQETFEASRQPEGFRLALQVLSTYVTLGIAAPVLVLAFWPAEAVWGLDVGIRVTSLTLFFAGLSLLLRFLFRYSTFLTSGEDRFPENLWQLITARQREV